MFLLNNSSTQQFDLTQIFSFIFCNIIDIANPVLDHETKFVGIRYFHIDKTVTEFCKIVSNVILFYMILESSLSFSLSNLSHGVLLQRITTFSIANITHHVKGCEKCSNLTHWGLASRKV